MHGHPIFDGISEEKIWMLKDAGLSEDGKTDLYDGRTGDRFEQRVVVGVMYMLGHHLVVKKYMLELWALFTSYTAATWRKSSIWWTKIW